MLYKIHKSIYAKSVSMYITVDLGDPTRLTNAMSTAVPDVQGIDIRGGSRISGGGGQSVRWI